MVIKKSDSVKINTDFIKLDQFLKWANLTGSGGEGKDLILNGKIKLNGTEEKRRGKKVRVGDIVEINVNGEIKSYTVIKE